MCCSVLVSTAHNRIYAGGINEFGYYEPGRDGSLKYYCMSDTLKDDCRYLGNVWNIHEADNIMYFQGDSRIVKYLNGKYTAIETDAKIDCSSMIKGILYIGTDRGVWVLVGNTPFPLQGAEDLASKRIRGIIPYKSGVLVVTAYNGCFTVTDAQWNHSLPVPKTSCAKMKYSAWRQKMTRLHWVLFIKA